MPEFVKVGNLKDKIVTVQSVIMVKKQGYAIMKRIIDSKVYNTETSKTLLEYSTGCDMNGYFESLEITKKGNFFRYRTGGAMTSMSVSVGQNSWGGSSDITAYTPQEAKEYILENSGKFDTEDIEELSKEYPQLALNLIEA